MISISWHIVILHSYQAIETHRIMSLQHNVIIINIITNICIIAQYIIQYDRIIQRLRGNVQR